MGDSVYLQCEERTTLASDRKTYPSVPAKAWWTLRQTFRQSPPTKVTVSYLATVLGVQENSARANILPGLKGVGLVSADGAPTPRANRWRDDQGYPEVCREILEEVYPQELRDAIPAVSADGDSKQKLEDWFLRQTGRGKSAASKMAALYSVLAEADPSGGKRVTARKPKRHRASRPGGKTSSAAASEKQDGSDRADAGPGGGSVPSLEMPEMRLNVEIRIDASVTPDQIDLIFASMAKHLYGRGDEGR